MKAEQGASGSMDEARTRTKNNARMTQDAKRGSRYGRIYFISNGAAIKIGFAKDVEARMRDLQVANHMPLLLMGSIAAPQSDERQFHDRLEPHRLLGEWFTMHPNVYDLIAELEDEDGWIEGESYEDYELKYFVMTGRRLPSR
jgi:hypothetical protein